MNKRFRIYGILLVFIMALSVSVGAGMFAVYAGVSKITVVDSGDLSGQTALPRSEWYVNKSDNSGTKVVDGVISFIAPKQASCFNLKKKIQDIGECGVKENFALTTKVKIEKLPENVKFYFAFGLPKMSSMPEEGGAALYLENKSGSIGFGMTSMDSVVTEFVLYQAVEGYETGSWLDISLKVLTDGTATGQIGTSTFSASGLPTSGFAGFGQTTVGDGRASILLKDLLLESYTNDTPENSDLFESFDAGAFNMNAFNSKSKASGTRVSKLSIENGKLNFVNTGSAYFATATKYSNVDVAFDVSDIVKETTFYEDGSPMNIRSCSFGVVFGMDINNYMERKGKLSVEFVPERGLETVTSVVIKSDRDVLTRVVLPEKYNMFVADDVYGMKISVNDGVVKVLLKNSSENGFTEVLNYEIGFTPLGYFEIAALGALDASFQKNLSAEQLSVGSFSIDNLSVVNNDFGKLVKLIDYMSNKESIPTDYEYVNEWDDADLLQSTIQ